MAATSATIAGRISAAPTPSRNDHPEMGPVVRQHHERFDGTGYPDRLRGEEIPLASSVISACDGFHAMISGLARYRSRA